jgi:hypothetical protein
MLLTPKHFQSKLSEILFAHKVHFAERNYAMGEVPGVHAVLNLDEFIIHELPEFN